MVFPALLLTTSVCQAVCISGHIPVDREYQQSTFVIKGMPVSQVHVDETPDGYFLDGTDSEIRVLKVFKGSPKQLTRVFSENSSGRFPLAVDIPYILFVHEVHGRLVVDNCGNSIRSSDAQTLVSKLETLADSSKGP